MRQSIPSRFRFGLLGALGTVSLMAFLCVWKVPAQTRASRHVDFGTEVLPILTDSCGKCHGPNMQMARLRLDAKSTAFQGGQSGKAIVPGKPGDSLLYQRIAGISEQARMPMGGKPLSPEQIATIRTWIEQGAEWPDGMGAQVAAVKTHWAFVPPVRPSVPRVSQPAWVRNPIDSFVLAKLDQEKLTPSPEADRATLLRRVSLDLTGLPPTPAEVDAFVNDRSAGAFEKQVDRLLASPHYGEKWGRTWLDAARYADSDGFEKDKQRTVWFYRDWVINALNRDLPYNQFVIDQVAGDLLPHATQDEIVATGFLRNSMINEEGGIEPEQFRMEAMFDRMDAIGKGILGITIQCAQCHTHKYDPIQHEDYYRMFAFLNNAHEANVAVYTPDENMKRADLFRQIRELEGTLRHHHSDWPQRMAEWEAQVTANQPVWTVLRPVVDTITDGGQRYVAMPDGSFLASGYAPTKHRVKMTVKTDVANITAFRLELLNDPNLPLGGPGRSLNGTGALTEFEVDAAPADHPDKTTHVKFIKATADINPPETELAAVFDDKSGRRRVTGPVDFAIDGKEDTAWGIDAGPGRRNQPRKAVFLADHPISNPGGTILTFYLRQDHGGWNSDDNQTNNLGRLRLSLTITPGAIADPLPASVREILAIPASQRTPRQMETVFSYWRTTVPDWKETNDQIEALWKQHPEGAAQLVLLQRAEPRETHILTRGDFLKPAKLVTPGVPKFLNPLPTDSNPDRLTFARWMVDPKAPTTARSLVNRVWQGYFGTGIVATSENFGTQCEPPSHPELLDWLAVEFMEKGWSQKKLHRLIVTSATYRQSSHVTPDLYARDPYNRLLARGPRFRMEAEMIRDVALADSGLLSLKMGGPSVFPPQPEGVWDLPYNDDKWTESKGEDKYRRAIYTFIRRTAPYPSLLTFDGTSREFCTVRRIRTNTPLQALTTLNDPAFFEAAQALARRLTAGGGKDPRAQAAYGFRLCTGRSPKPAELDRLLAGFENERAYFAAHPMEATRTSKGGNATLAAWTIVSNALLNLDEAITKP